MTARALSNRKKKMLPGQAGGNATFELYGSGYYSEMAKKAHRKRQRAMRMAEKGTLTKKKSR